MQPAKRNKQKSSGRTEEKGNAVEVAGRPTEVCPNSVESWEATDDAPNVENETDDEMVIQDHFRYDFIEDWEERYKHPSHPMQQLCENCKQLIRLLECGSFVLRYQPIFHFFSDEQLLEMENYIQGEDRETMKLPSATQQSSGQGRGNGRNGIPFLKIENLTEKPVETKILGVNLDTEGRFGTQVIVKVSIMGRSFKWGLAPGKNPNYAALVDNFGDDSEAWVGKTMWLGLERDPFEERLFPHATFAAPAVATKK